MSKGNIIIKNLFRVTSNMFTQFSTEEPLISDEAKAVLNNINGREEIFNKIISNPKPGDVTVTIEGEDITFFVEA